MKARPRIVVLGGGFGGLETAFYLKMRLGERAALTLISDRDTFLYKPNTIYIPFGLDPAKLLIPLDVPAHRRGIQFIHATAREIDPEAKLVGADGRKLPYDYLVVATGAGMRPEEVPGLKEFAQTIWTPDDMLRLREAYAKLADEARGGQRRRLLFLVPPNNKCSGPLYEIVMMTDTWLRRTKARRNIDIAFSTYEAGFIQAFGPRLHEVVTREFEQRGIDGHTGYVVERIEKDHVAYRNGETLGYDLLVSFPPYVASTPFASLPVDERGFIATEFGSRQVKGYPEVYAVGDTGDFPVKQAFLAFLQADASAEHLTSTILGKKCETAFDPVSMCVMEQFDKATFAQVPLALTGDSSRPVTVRPDADGAYRVGSSPAWRVGKKLLGLYLPWRFRDGQPFHAGAPWQGMQLGLKAMSAVLAK